MNIEKVHSDLTAEQLNQNAKQKELHKGLKETLHGTDNPALIFAHLVSIATPILEAFHSDLYYDAMYLQAADLTKEQTFFYLVGKNGTTWADNYEQAISLSQHGREHIFRITYKKSTEYKYSKDVFTLTVKKVAGLYGRTPKQPEYNVMPRTETQMQEDN